MRHFCLLLPALLAVAVPTRAQVTVDLQALDALPAAKPPAKPTRPARPVQRHSTAPKPQPAPKPAPAEPAPAVATTAPPAPAPGPTPTPAPPAPPVATAPFPPPATLPTAPPPTIALAPVSPPSLPTTQATPPPPPPISDTSTTATVPTGTGLRVTFAAGQADLSPASAAAIKNVVQTAPGGATSFNVVAYAAGTPEDPSTARRLSLARALAVRSALMANGVTSSRIYVRALGPPTDGEPPDRVELAVMGGNAGSSVPASAPAPDAAPKSQTQ